MTPRHVRALRGTSAAGIATIIAATAHTLAGGGAPPPLFIVVVALLATPLAVALAGRRLALWRIALTVFASQLLFHVAFAIVGSAGSSPMPAGHDHHAAMLPLGDAVAVAAPDTLMLLGHTIAALMTVALIHRGESVLRALGRGILRLLRPALIVVPPRRPRRVAALVAVLAAAASVVFSDLSRRGPPVVAAAL